MYVQEDQAKHLLRSQGFPLLRFGSAKTLEEVNVFLRGMEMQKASIQLQGESAEKQVGHSKDEVLAIARTLIERNQDAMPAQRLLLQEIPPWPKLGEIRYGICYAKGGYTIEGEFLKVPFSWTLLPGERVKERGVNMLKNPSFASLLQQGLDLFCTLHSTSLSVQVVGRSGAGDYAIAEVAMYFDPRSCVLREELANLYDPLLLTLEERIAEQFDLEYHALGGKIGCVVSGLGIGYAILDRIAQLGEEASCLLNVERGVSLDRLHAGFRILLADTKTKAILLYLTPKQFSCQALDRLFSQVLCRSPRKVPVVCIGDTEELYLGKNQAKNRMIAWTEQLENGIDMVVNGVKH